MSLFGKPKYATTPKSGNSEDKKKVKIPPGIIEKCKDCSESYHKDEWKKNLEVCLNCGYLRSLSAQERITLLTDEGSFKEIDHQLRSVDVLKFEGVSTYVEKLEQNMLKTGLNDAMVCGTAKLDNIDYALGIMDFRFLGASMGVVVGEKVTRVTELATEKGLPLVIVTASGGARMYEGMFSLMQMAKTSGALERFKAKGLPYIVIMTNPTTAGVTASYASLGDVIIAEPKALIGFAGPRVIKDTTQAILPEGFQSSEFLLKKGLIDRVIPRSELRKELGLILNYLTNSKTKSLTKKKKAQA